MHNGNTLAVPYPGMRLTGSSQGSPPAGVLDKLLFCSLVAVCSLMTSAGFGHYRLVGEGYCRPLACPTARSQNNIRLGISCLTNCIFTDCTPDAQLKFAITLKFCLVGYPFSIPLRSKNNNQQFDNADMHLPLCPDH